MDNFWRDLEWKMFLHFMPISNISTAIWYILWPFGNLVVIWYIFTRFGILYHLNSGNPDRCSQQIRVSFGHEKR
jgi:hypothetical protein